MTIFWCAWSELENFNSSKVGTKMYSYIKISFSDFKPEYIIHMESIEDDVLCYLEACPRVNEKDLRHLKHVNISPKGHSGKAKIQKAYFKQLDQKLLEQLQDKYWPDFVVHGYTIEPFIDMVK